MAEDVLQYLSNIRDMSLDAQRTLRNDARRIDDIDDAMSRNLSSVSTEIGRINTLITSSSSSCRRNCALIAFIVAVWVGMYVLMKILPSPRRGS